MICFARFVSFVTVNVFIAVMTTLFAFPVQVLDPGNPSGASDFNTWPRKPTSGELRKVRIDKYDKSTEPLGIQISCKANGGGVFVSSVSENSLASQVGLQVCKRAI